MATAANGSILNSDSTNPLPASRGAPNPNVRSWVAGYRLINPETLLYLSSDASSVVHRTKQKPGSAITSHRSHGTGHSRPATSSLKHSRASFGGACIPVPLQVRSRDTRNERRQRPPVRSRQPQSIRPCGPPRARLIPHI
jgi:hypothetical protein